MFGKASNIEQCFCLICIKFQVVTFINIPIYIEDFPLVSQMTYPLNTVFLPAQKFSRVPFRERIKML